VNGPDGRGFRFVRLFWNRDERRLRAPWRLVLQPVLTLAIGGLPAVALGESLSWLRRRGLLRGVSDLVFDKIADLFVGPLIAILILVSLALAARWLDRRRFIDLGFRITPRWLKDLAFGFAVSGLVMTALFTVAFMAGWVRVTGVPRVTAGLPLLLGISYSVVKVACVAVYEEAFSRGYQLRNLAEGLRGFRGLNERSAILLSACLSSALFGLLHARNENATVLSSVVIALIGVLYALPYVLTGQLGASIGLHVGWNLFQGSAFGFPDSGDLEPASLLAIELTGPDVLVGGAFGPEAGLLSVLALLLGMAVILLSARRGAGIRIDRGIARYSPGAPRGYEAGPDSVRHANR
jgi:hypothetical protein